MSDVTWYTTHFLRWKREYRPGAAKRVVTAVKAWAPELNPAQPMPPYYRITRASKNSTLRRVQLVNCKTCGGDLIDVCGLVDDLAAAKHAAQVDYQERLAQQALTTPPKSV